MKKQIKKLIKFLPLLFLLTFIPLAFVQAQTPSICTGTGLANVICKMNELLKTFLPVLVSLGVIYFIWGVVQYVIGGGEEAKKKGKDHIIYGIIGLAVIVSVWGLTIVLRDTFFSKGDLSAPTTDIANLVSKPVDSSCGDLSKPDTKLSNYLNYVTCVIGSSVIPFIFAIAVVSFVWGAVKFFIINADEEAKRQQGKQFMIWGIVALTVMLSVWGLVHILAVTFGFGDNASVLPSVKPK